MISYRRGARLFGQSEGRLHWQVPRGLENGVVVYIHALWHRTAQLCRSTLRRDGVQGDRIDRALVIELLLDGAGCRHATLRDGSRPGACE